MIQLILAVSLWEVIFLWSERFLLLICMVSQFMWKKDFVLRRTYLQKTLQILTHAFYWLYFTQRLTSFSSINRLLRLCESLILFVFGDFTSIIRTDLPILVKLIGQVNCVMISLSQMTLLRWLTFLLGSRTVIPIVLLFWIYFFFWGWYIFYNDFPSIRKFWSCCLIFHWHSIKFTTECPVSLHSLWLFSCWLGRSSWSFERCSMREYLQTRCFCCC